MTKQQQEELAFAWLIGCYEGMGKLEEKVLEELSKEPTEEKQNDRPTTG